VVPGTKPGTTFVEEIDLRVPALDMPTPIPHVSALCSRLRWSNTAGSIGSPLGSPSGSRRLRSQPVDLTSLRPDAFAFSPPPKRSRVSFLQSAVVNLEHLRSLEGTTLARYHSRCLDPPGWDKGPTESAALELVAGQIGWLATEFQPACQVPDAYEYPAPSLYT